MNIIGALDKLCSREFEAVYSCRHAGKTSNLIFAHWARRFYTDGEQI
jgi:hypothetical protein